MSIKENYLKVKKQISDSCEKVNRNPQEVTLVGVTKNTEIARVKELVNAGCNDIGENRLYELEEKYLKLKDMNVKIHFIGHLQSNKARKIVEMANVIHSVDSLKLLGKINNAAFEFGKKQKVFLQVNVSGEEQKSGFEVGEMEHVISDARKFENIEVLGLMTMAPFTNDKETIHSCFRKLHELKEKFKLKELSMGMTNDFIPAIANGATFVRVGRKIFE